MSYTLLSGHRQLRKRMNGDSLTTSNLQQPIEIKNSDSPTINKVNSTLSYDSFTDSSSLAFWKNACSKGFKTWQLGNLRQISPYSTSSVTEVLPKVFSKRQCYVPPTNTFFWTHWGQLDRAWVPVPFYLDRPKYMWSNPIKNVLSISERRWTGARCFNG